MADDAVRQAAVNTHDKPSLIRLNAMASLSEDAREVGNHYFFTKYKISVLFGDAHSVGVLFSEIF